MKSKVNFLNKTLATLRIRPIISWIIRNRSLLISNKKRDYLNIGCGRNTFDSFYNLDYSWYRGIDACWDISRSLPFPDESFRGCFSEHCLEHVSLPVFRRVIAEVYRILRPGACFRIVVPDAEIYLRSYLAELNGETVDIPYRNLQNEKTALMSVNRIFREHGHQYAWDFRTIEIHLAEAGFTQVRRMKYMEGQDSRLLIDVESRAIESLYVEAVKP